MTSVEWYFDFLSPFAYFQSRRLDELPDDVEITFRPILFGGLVVHYETKGPGQIPPKRLLTMRHAKWQAGRLGVPYRVPSAFPFNPLKALRLAISLGAERATIETIFSSIWGDGHLPETADGWQAICRALGVDDADERVARPEVKQALIDNGLQAIEAGVFGVPTFVLDGTIFWGTDETDFLIDVLKDPGILTDSEMAGIATMPVGQRPGTDETAPS